MQDRRALLVYHLRHNHVPALPLAFVAVAERALELVEDGALDERVDLPGGAHTSAEHCIRLLHLDDFRSCGG